MSKVADGEGSSGKTSQAVADAKESRKEKKEEKLTKMIEETRAELKEDGHIELAPGHDHPSRVRRRTHGADGGRTRYFS